MSVGKGPWVGWSWISNWSAAEAEIFLIISLFLLGTCKQATANGENNIRKKFANVNNNMYKILYLFVFYLFIIITIIYNLVTIQMMFLSNRSKEIWEIAVP